VDEPRAVSISPDAKSLLVVESPGFGVSAPTVSLWSVPDNKEMARKWNPYPPPAKAAFDAPNLYRAEFIGNDKVITLSTGRMVDVWPLPKFDPKIVDGVAVISQGDLLGKDDRFGQTKFDRYQRQAAFTADHRLMAVWNGASIVVVGTADGQEVFSTGPLSENTKEWWQRKALLDRIKPGPMAFSPDGKYLASIVTHEAGSKQHLLCLWDIKSQKMTDPYEIPTNQFNDAAALEWWGNRYVVTFGGKVEGMLIDVQTGLAKRQLMGPKYSKYGFGRDGRLWYAISDDLKSPATMYVVDNIDPNQLTEADDYEQIVELREDFFLRRLWLEKSGVMRKQSDPDPSLRLTRLIRRP
jgi:WD40 repeat protein